LFTAPSGFYNQTTIEEIFGLYTYPTSAYRQYIGLDYTALFSGSISVNEKFVVVGSNGYSEFILPSLEDTV
jgi:hypothetical protein